MRAKVCCLQVLRHADICTECLCASMHVPVHVCVYRVHVHTVSSYMCMPLCTSVCLRVQEPGEGVAETRS